MISRLHSRKSWSPWQGGRKIPVANTVRIASGEAVSVHNEASQQETESGGSRILIARIGALGDTLMATPVIRGVRETNPDARIDFLASALAAPLLQFHPELNRVFSLRRRNFPYFLSPEKWGLAAELRKGRYTGTVLLESAPRYLELLERAGLTGIRGFHTTPSKPEIHSAANNLRAAGFTDWAERSLRSELYYPPENSFRARQLLAGLAPPIVGIHPGYGPAQKKSDQAGRLKGWPTAAFQDLLELLLESGMSVVLTGSSGDRAESRRISSRKPNHSRIRDVAGHTSVLELAALIAEVDGFVSVDSGPGHLAAAVGTPLVVLWGPAKLHQVQPIPNGGTVTILKSSVPCAPCYDTPAMKACRDNICMKRILPEEVFAALEKVLTGSAEGS
jgi:ADP-heptose:LPS heptosyltransferase